jgi:hypothetical protein
MMRATKYTTDPKEVYTLELNKLQLCFSEVTRIGEEASELSRVGWRQVEILRQMNFMLEGAMQVGEMIIRTHVQNS